MKGVRALGIKEFSISEKLKEVQESWHIGNEKKRSKRGNEEVGRTERSPITQGFSGPIKNFAFYSKCNGKSIVE